MAATTEQFVIVRKESVFTPNGWRGLRDLGRRFWDVYSWETHADAERFITQNSLSDLGSVVVKLVFWADHN